MAERLYKWMLRRDGQLVTAVQRTPWPVAVGEWTAEESPVLCESGWHAMREKDVLTHLPRELGAELWVVEARGRIMRGNDKLVAPSMRLVECLGVTDASNLRLFACDVAEDTVSRIEFFDPRSGDAITVARRFALGEATVDELDAAWAAARDAVWAAAWAAAWDAARYAARSAAWDATWYAAWALYSNWLVVRLESGY